MKPLILILSFCFFGCIARASDNTGVSLEETDTSFLLAIEDAFFVAGSGVVVTGVIESGTALPGMQVEIKGNGKTFTATVGFISMYTKQIGYAKKGDAIGLNLRGVQKDDIKRGMVVVAPNTIQFFSQLTVSLVMLAAGKSATPTILKNNQSVQLLSRTEILSATILTTAELKPGDTETVTIKLATAAPFRPNDKIAVKYLGKIIANGTVTRLE